MSDEPMDSQFEVARTIAFLLATIQHAASGDAVSSETKALLAGLAAEDLDLLAKIAAQLRPVQP